MNKKDIVEMYRKGYSIKFICDEYYKTLNKDCEKAHYYNNVLIIPKKLINRKTSDKIVFDVICAYNSATNEM